MGWVGGLRSHLCKIFGCRTAEQYGVGVIGGVCYDGGGEVGEASMIKIMIRKIKDNKENYRRLIYLKNTISLHKRYHLIIGLLSTFYCLAR